MKNIEVMNQAISALKMALPWVDESSNNTDAAQMMQAIDALRAAIDAPEVAQTVEPTKGQIKTWIDLSTVDGYFSKECLATIAFQNGALEAKFADQTVPPAWMPIETAPKDGTSTYTTSIDEDCL